MAFTLFDGRAAYGATGTGERRRRGRGVVLRRAAGRRHRRRRLSMGVPVGQRAVGAVRAAVRRDQRAALGRRAARRPGAGRAVGRRARAARRARRGRLHRLPEVARRSRRRSRRLRVHQGADRRLSRAPAGARHHGRDAARGLPGARDDRTGRDGSRVTGTDFHLLPEPCDVDASGKADAAVGHGACGSGQRRGSPQRRR